MVYVGRLVLVFYLVGCVVLGGVGVGVVGICVWGFFLWVVL